MRRAGIVVAGVLAIMWMLGVGNDAAGKEAPLTFSAVESQASDGPPVEGNEVDESDSRLEVQLWTLLAAAGAAGLGLLLLLVRIAMGWVKRPPPQEQSHH